MPNKYASIIERITDSPSRPRRPPLTSEQLREFEDKQGYGIPTDYVEFLRDYGGIGVSALYPMEDSRQVQGVISIFFDTSHSEPLFVERNTFELEWAPTLRQVLELGDEVVEVDDPPRELLGIAIDPGGNQVYLSLIGRYAGHIFLWKNWADIYFVANSFEEFMKSLQPWNM